MRLCLKGIVHPRTRSWRVRALAKPATAADCSDVKVNRLLAAVPRNDDSRFDAMVRAHYVRLVAFAWRYVRSRDVAADVVQDVLAAVWMNEARLDYADPLPYLYRSVHNRALSEARHALVHERYVARVEHDLKVSGITEPQARSASSLEADELSAAIQHAVDALPERRRAVFLLSRDGGLTYAEIARSLGISEKTVETHMTNALRTLRGALIRFLPAVVAFAAAAAASVPLRLG